MQQVDQKLCKKCKEQRAVIVAHKDPLCRQCFLLHVEHAFKMTLRSKCQVTQKNERILLCVSGGQNSIAMAKLASDLVHNRCIHNKSVMFLLAEVLHIDESFVVRHFVPQYKNKDVGTFAEKECQLPYHELHIQNLYDDPQHLLQHLEALPEYGSAREDFVRYLKFYQIWAFALEKGFKKICLGQNGQRLAADLMAQLAKGKGLSMGSATKYWQPVSFPAQFFADQFDQPVVTLELLRPMKDLLNKEVLYYLRCKENPLYPAWQLDSSICRGGTQNKPARGNIDHLLEDFVDKLQTNFPSTTFTVLSTAEKATFKVLERVEFCPLCLEQRDKVYNRLEVETLDNSNQSLINELSEKTRYFEIFCFSCKRLLQAARDIESFYNLANFPKAIRRVADAILEV